MAYIKHYPAFLAKGVLAKGALMSALLCVLALPAHASDKQRLTYEVYAGGIHAVEATLDLDMSMDGRYSAIVNAKTRGFLAKLAPWKGSFETHGWKLSDDDLRPELHKSVGYWKGEDETKEYNYSKDGGFQSLYVKDFKKLRKHRTIDAKLTDDTIDVLTATLLAFDQTEKTGECSGSDLVFDGKRRFKMTFQQQKIEQLAKSKYNIYEGEAARCTVEVEPAGGGWHKKPRGWMSIQEQGRDKGTLPTLWIAQVEENGPFVPIKILVKTDYGALFMHLAKYEGAGDFVVASKKRK